MAVEALKKRTWFALLDQLETGPFSQSQLSWLVSTFLLLLILLFLWLYPFPHYQESSEIEVTEEIFEIFEPEMVPVLVPKVSEREVETEAATLFPGEEEIEEVFDFETFENLAESGDLIQEMTFFQDAGGGMEEMLKEMESTLDGDFTSGDLFLTGEGDDLVDPGTSGMLKTGEKPGISQSEGSAIPSSGQGKGRGGGIGDGVGAGKSIGTGTGVSVTLKSFGEDDYQGKEIFDPLIEWIRSHSVTHEYTIRSFLEQKSGDLTSVVRFRVNARVLEMYLQVTEETKELTIFIVEGSQFSKLVDQGISKKSHRLELGRVDRMGHDNRIVNIFAMQTAPTREKTNDFMSLFLSWWNEGSPLE